MSTFISKVKFNVFQTHEVPAATSEQRVVEIPPTIHKEEAFSFKKYFAIAFVIRAMARVIFPDRVGTSTVLFAAASWYFFSAVIILANRIVHGTCLDKLVHQVHALAMELNSGFATAALFPRTLFKSYHGPWGNLTGRPILMVNGYLSFGSLWHYQRKRMIHAGFGPIYTMNVGSGKSIKIYAKQIQEKVKRIQEEMGRNDLILIGHSKGGLVSSYYATHLADSTGTNITDVVTIGSPLAGTPLAYLGLGQDAYEMRPNAEFHQELRNKIREKTQIRFFHIASAADEIVSLSSALLGEDRSRQFVLKDIGHLGLIFSSRVGDQISFWLQTARSG